MAKDEAEQVMERQCEKCHEYIEPHEGLSGGMCEKCWN